MSVNFFIFLVVVFDGENDVGFRCTRRDPNAAAILNGAPVSGHENIGHDTVETMNISDVFRLKCWSENQTKVLSSRVWIRLIESLPSLTNGAADLWTHSQWLFNTPHWLMLQLWFRDSEILFDYWFRGFLLVDGWMLTLRFFFLNSGLRPSKMFNHFSISNYSTATFWTLLWYY